MFATTALVVICSKSSPLVRSAFCPMKVDHTSGPYIRVSNQYKTRVVNLCTGKPVKTVTGAIYSFADADAHKRGRCQKTAVTCMCRLRMSSTQTSTTWKIVDYLGRYIRKFD